MKKKLLITAGPTREKVDAVRFLSNRSSGKMGYAIAQAAYTADFDVTLISGPVSLPTPENITTIQVESAAEMSDAVKSIFAEQDIVIMAAAVADYRPKTVYTNKLKKLPGDLVLELERTEDILAALGKLKQPHQTLVGFAAETDDLIANALGKLERKNLDWIVANDVSSKEQGMGADDNAVTMISRKNQRTDIAKMAKDSLAKEILKILIA